MEPYSGLIDALARIAAASTPQNLWLTVKDFAQHFGFSHVVVVDPAKLHADAREAVIYTDAPRQLFQAIDRERAYDRHPLVQRVLHSHVPFTVSEMRNDPKHQGERGPDLLTDIAKRGDGLVIPVYDAGKPVAGVGFSGEKPDTSALARAMLQVIAHAAIDKSKELRDGKARTSIALSVREAQCLRLVAVGKVDAEIGQVLGISARTVRFHVDSAKAKLGAATRIQAVARALRERVIAI